MTMTAVMFDLDETLLNRTLSLHRFLVDQVSRFAALGGLDPQLYVDRFMVLDQRGLVTKSTVYPELLKSLDCERAGLATSLLTDYENRFWHFATPFDGMWNMFHEMSVRGLKTAIVTNGQTHIQLRSLLALTLDRLADTYLISETEGLRKPGPAIFRLAAERLDVETVECVFVGDNPTSDIVGAQAVGMKTVWFPNGATWPKDQSDLPDAEISSLPELIRLIDAWA